MSNSKPVINFITTEEMIILIVIKGSAYETAHEKRGTKTPTTFFVTVL
jgi:hypothetical protein